VYSPPAEITPTSALPPGIPSTFHVTAGFWLLTTVAVNCCGWIVDIEAAAGVTVTAIGGGGFGGGVLAGVPAAISLLSPPPQPARTLAASSTSAKSVLVRGPGEAVIAGCHPAVSIAADVILEVVVMPDRILKIAAVMLDASRAAFARAPITSPGDGIHLPVTV